MSGSCTEIKSPLSPPPGFSQGFLLFFKVLYLAPKNEREMEENDSPSSAITIPCLNDRDAGGGFSSSISNWSRSFKTSVLFDPLTTTDIDHNTPDRQSTTVIREEGRPLLAKEISLKDEETLLYRKSSLNQSIFNSVNVLMGVGVLSLPVKIKNGLIYFRFSLRFGYPDGFSDSSS